MSNLSKLGPPIKTSIACQCDIESCQLSMTFDNIVYENGDITTRIWMFGGRPDGQALYILHERERLCMAWMLVVPDKPVPHHLSDQLLREQIVIELLERTVSAENKTVGDFIKQATQSNYAGVQNVAIVDGGQE